MGYLSCFGKVDHESRK
jgi:hypothetical protein